MFEDRGATTAAVVSMILGGSSDHVYSIGLQFRGFIELRNYTGGTSQGEHFQVGGDTPDPADTFNVYKLEVSDPAGVYYVNRGAEGPGVAVDYIANVEIRGGATVTLSTEAMDGIEADNKNHVVIGGIPPSPTWYDGEFLQMDVVR
jgi:hypothetical protein